MYAIYGNIYHQYTPNVSIYTIHGSYGRWLFYDIYIKITDFSTFGSMTSGCYLSLTFVPKPGACATASVRPQDYSKNPVWMGKNDPNLLSFEIVLLDLPIKSHQKITHVPSFYLENTRDHHRITRTSPEKSPLSRPHRFPPPFLVASVLASLRRLGAEAGPVPSGWSWARRPGILRMDFGMDFMGNYGKSPCLIGKSAFLMGKSPYLMENHWLTMERSTHAIDGWVNPRDWVMASSSQSVSHYQRVFYGHWWIYYDISIPIDIPVDGLLDDINDIYGFFVGMKGFCFPQLNDYCNITTVIMLGDVQLGQKSLW